MFIRKAFSRFLLLWSEAEAEPELPIDWTIDWRWFGE